MSDWRTEAQLGELLSLERRRNLWRQVTLQRYLDDPVAWVNDFVEFPEGQGLTPYQTEILGELPERKRVAVRGPHGLGKGAVVSLGTLWFSTTRDAAGLDWKSPSTASRWRQLTQYLWPEIHKWARKIRWDALARDPFDPRVELMALQLKLGYGAAFGVASDTPAGIEGAHADHMLYILDEAKSIITPTWDAVEGAFSGGNIDGRTAYCIATSTPGEPAGRFYEIHNFKPGLEDWWVRHVKLWECIDARRIDSSWVNARKLQWGEQSAIYQNRVLGEFAEHDPEAVIPLAWVEAANERYAAYLDDRGHFRPGLPMTSVGVDVARGGEDRSVIASLYGDAVIGPTETLDVDDTMRIAARVEQVVDRSGDKPMIVVDAVGVGAGVADRLRQRFGRSRVIAHNGSERADDTDRTGDLSFSNARSLCWWKLREALDPDNYADGDTMLALPPEEALSGDLTAPRWKDRESTGNIQIEPKEALKNRIGHSPDYGDSVTLAFRGRSVRRKGRTNIDLLVPNRAEPELVGATSSLAVPSRFHSSRSRIVVPD